MERTSLLRILLAIAAAGALVAAGALLPKPAVIPADSPVADSATVPPQLAPAAADALGQASPAAADQGRALQQVAVYVCGAVRKPGVYTLASGTRVVDAIAQAGGVTPKGDLEQLNLAAQLTDAMKIDVPINGQVNPSLSDSSVAAGYSGAAGYSRPSTAPGVRAGRHRSSRAGAQKLQPGQTLDINTASETQLQQIPGIGPGLARRIVDYRAANGPFQTADDLQNVSGVGPSKFAKMEPFIRV
jgi:competence protein ComEA